jgi:putative membrane-bound dehydrogenase-like protein
MKNLPNLLTRLPSAPGRGRPVLVLLAAAALLAAWPGDRSDLGAQQKRAANPHDPANAVANLDVYPGLAATLFAAEPVVKAPVKVDDRYDRGLRPAGAGLPVGLTNPTNIDIDYRGRVWVCDVMNYRGHNGMRPRGDRILIFEDTNGDGKYDRAKVFYQGRDVDSAMGICVLGNRVIVSSSPNVLVFTFDDNDKILKKEALFTRTGQPQHDHSAHTFVFGPDGRLYWNFGNTGGSVHDKSGKQVVDLAGNAVRNDGHPYWDGLVFRCDEDGGNFEVLGHNFRNNYEVAVDSFGTLWQSDNDDDGNRGVRINYVMEFGNYGYRDEVTGAGWGSPRTNLEPDVPRRHWHQNDPGVVPNLLQTGGGSPTGITVYEGNLLPEVFHNQVIHCDAGPSIVRAYPVQKQGAGYRAGVVNILDGSKKDNWFRPVDPRVAPDGSLFVSDWYDPGVGGHAQADSNRGRVFRVAPPGSNYVVPTFNFTTPTGAALALKSPCSSVRYLAWKALHRMGKDAEGDLLKLWHSAGPRYRARGLWLLGRIQGKGPHYVAEALKDQDADIRITGLRLARQLTLDLPPLVRRLVRDPDAAVRRECAIALRHCKAAEAPALWAELAAQHDGKDRWYLEALGIGADRQWDAFLAAYLKKAAPTEAQRDVIWRSRARQTPELLARLITDPATPAAELPRLFRAFDFQQAGPVKDAALVGLAFAKHDGEAGRRELVAVEALRRLSGFDVKKHRAVIERTLGPLRGTATYVELVSRLSLAEHYPDLLALAQKVPDQQLGVTALRTLLEKGQAQLIGQALRSGDEKAALATVQALATAVDDRSVALLLPLAQDAKRDVELRRQAVRALARTRGGALALVNLARTKRLGEDLQPVAGSALGRAPWPDVKASAARLFPLPASKENRPLPPLAELVRLRGDPANGRKVFATTGTCATCHTVNGEGKDVGPDLSEIGKKLSREAVLEAIVFPSAGIDHNYETWVAELKSGGVVNGLLASKTAEGVSLKGADGIVRTFKRDEIDNLAKSPVSLMPADLAKALTVRELTDVVEYLLTLREAKAAPGKRRP